MNFYYFPTKSTEVNVDIEQSYISSYNKKANLQDKNEECYENQENLIHYDNQSGLTIHNYSNGKMRYKGEWSGGLPHGKGTMYDDTGSVLYTGLWGNGEFEVDHLHHFIYRDNSMEERYEDGTLKYYGEWENGVPYGHGKFYLRNGRLLLEGEWMNGLCSLDNGSFYNYRKEKYCHIKNSKIVYIGEVNEQFEYDGEGIKYNDDCKEIYHGFFKNGVYDGFGVLTNDYRVIYKGEWKNGKPTGRKGVDNRKFGDYSSSKDNEEKTQKIDYKKAIKTIKTICILGIVFVLGYYVMKIFSSKVVVKNMFEYYLPKPFMTSLSFSHGCGNSKKGPLVISGYKRMKKLTFRMKTFQNIQSLEIINNPVLEEIAIFDGFDYDGTKPFMNMRGYMIVQDLPQLKSIDFPGYQLHHASSLILSNLPLLTELSTMPGSFRDAETLIIDNLPWLRKLSIPANSFISCNHIDLSNLPQLKELRLGEHALQPIPVFTLSDLPSLTTFSTGAYSFYNTTHLSLSNLPSLQSIFFSSYAFNDVQEMDVSNVPFTNGKVSFAGIFFSSLNCTAVQTDEVSRAFSSAIHPFIEDCEIPPQPCERRRLNLTIERNVGDEGSGEFFALRDSSSIIRFRQPFIEDYHQYSWKVTLCEGVYSLLITTTKYSWHSYSSVTIKHGSVEITKYGNGTYGCSWYKGVCVKSFILQDNLLA